MKVEDALRADALARRTRDLLDGHGPSNAIVWRRQHLQMIASAGWLTENGSVRWASLLPEIRARLPTRWWHSLGLRTDIEHPSHWIGGLVRTPRKSAHPLLHLAAEALLKDTGTFTGVMPLLPIVRRVIRPKQPVKSQRVEKDRRLWQEMTSKAPAAGPKVWRTEAPALYARLYRHSKSWFLRWNRDHHCVRHATNTQRVDWASLDKTLSRKLPAASQYLADSAEHRRRRISQIGLLRRLSSPALHPNQLRKLPMLCAALDRFAETDEQFLRRRLSNALNEFATEHDCQPKAWQVLRSAGVRSPWSESVLQLATDIIRAYPWMKRTHGAGTSGKQKYADQGMAVGTSRRRNAGSGGIS